MKIKAIELISEKEWNKIQKLSNVNVQMFDWWWLRDWSANSTTDFRGVYYGGYASNYDATNSGNWLRPAIVIETLKELTKNQIVYILYKNKLTPFVCITNKKNNQYTLFSNALLEESCLDSKYKDYEVSEARQKLQDMVKDFSHELYILSCLDEEKNEQPQKECSIKEVLNII